MYTVLQNRQKLIIGLFVQFHIILRALIELFDTYRCLHLQKLQQHIYVQKINSYRLITAMFKGAKAIFTTEGKSEIFMDLLYANKL